MSPGAAALVPRDGVKAIRRALDASNGDALMRLTSDGRLLVVTTHQRVVTQLSAGVERFPKYESVLPERETMSRVRVDRDALRKAVDRAREVGRTSAGTIALDVEHARVLVRSHQADVDSTEAVAVLEHVSTYEGATVLIDGRFLSDALTHLEGDEIEWWYSATRPNAVIQVGRPNIMNVLAPRQPTATAGG